MTDARPSPRERDVVAASLLRPGSGSRAARLFKDLGGGGPSGPTLSELAAALEPRSGHPAEEVRLARAEAAAALGRAQAAGIDILPVGDARYPPRLAQVPDPPIVLWTAGDPTWLVRPAVAIVGSRRPSAANLLLARRLGRDLARAGLVVVSGLAIGIDAAAHEGAVEGGGQTVAVLGAGVDVVYPRRNGDLRDRIVRTGCLVSELAPGTPPLAHHFPLRNRIISGLSLAVVVVEAAERSGSLITARMALEQGRDVLAVPGSVVSGCHQGCHALIKDGAGLVEGAADVLAAIGWVGHVEGAGRPADGLLGSMRQGAPMSLDDIVVQAGRPAGDLLAELGMLEVAGRVARIAGGLFVRLD